MDPTRERHRDNLTRQASFARGYSPLTATMVDLLTRWMGNPESAPHPEAAARFVGRLVDFIEGKGRPDGPWANTLQATLRLHASLHWFVLTEDPRAVPMKPWFHTAGGNATPQEGELEGTLLEVADALGDELFTRATRGRVRTNETSRGLAWLLPAVMVGADAVTLIELGSGGGLNLYAEQRSWDLRWEENASALRIGQAGVEQFRVAVSGLRLDQLDPPLSAEECAGPEVLLRAGCDAHPIDLRDPAMDHELAACVWGDQPRRLERLREGLAVHRRALYGHGRLARVRPVELPDELPDFLGQVAPQKPVAPVICFNTFVTVYMSDVAHRAVSRTIGEFAKRWTVQHGLPWMWVRLEPARAGESQAPHPGWCRWVVDLWDDRARHKQLELGWTHPHLVRMELGPGLVELRSLRDA